MQILYWVPSSSFGIANVHQMGRNARPVRELVRQWNRVVEKDGLLYRRILRPDGGEEVYQLL